MHLNSATTIRVPTKGGSAATADDNAANPSLAMNINRDNSNNNNNNHTGRRRSRTWSLGSNFDLLDNNNHNNNYLRRNISNGSLDFAAGIFSSLQELTPRRSISSTSALNALGIQVGAGGGGGGAAMMSDYDNSHSTFLVGGAGATDKEGTRPGSVGLNLDSLYESELRVGRGAGVAAGQGNRSLAMAMKTSEAASALRRIEMEERLEEQQRQRMKEILHIQLQQNQLLSNESRKTLLSNQGGRYTPVQMQQSISPHSQRLQLSKQLLMQEQLRYQNQRQNQSLSPSRWPSSQNSRLTDLSTEELYLELSRRSRGDSSTVVSNVSGDAIGGMGIGVRGGEGEGGGRVDSGHYLPSKIGQRNEGAKSNVMNAALRGGMSEMVHHRKRSSSEGDSGGGARDSIVMAPASITKTSSKLVDEATNSSVDLSNTRGVRSEGDRDVPEMQRLRTRNTSFDTLLSVFGDELAELDREESDRRNPRGNVRGGTSSYQGSVGTITLEEYMANASGDEGTDSYESSSSKKSPAISEISPINVDIHDTNFPPRQSSGIIEQSPSVTTASMDAMTVESIVRERALLQMRMEMREHLARAAGFPRAPGILGGGLGVVGGDGPSSLPSSLGSSSANAYLSELKGLVLPPPPLMAMPMHGAQQANSIHQGQVIHPSATAKNASRHSPPRPPSPDKIDPKVALQQFLDKYGESAETSRTDLLNAISETEKSLVTIHDWDRSRGLRKCHSRTVVKTRRSRAKVKAFLLGVDPPKELVKKSTATKRKAENDP